ncbi:Na+/H+ antiporter subunit E [Anianabacter salinae]|uniref:Na+/H+ antiporter subunit E n=1 Tax=Anianabacter salinae TaxID=2851023 RepID=UPI00225E2AD4|nr:Na+/H+ antiporter subunit E [Anianabacter salinae]MBV0910753.1 Na+/H+ antiporter subunit E [Anianabacter salinae]
MLRRLFPHPLLSILLALIWLALVNTVTVGQVVLGGVLGIVVPLITAAYWPGRPRMRAPLMIVEYIVVVVWDIIVANIQVALIIVFKRQKDLKSEWVTVPLELRSPEAITVLAGTITMTPGTVSAMLSSCGTSILVHCLHTDDPVAVRNDIKTRYERRLKEIFP